MWLPPRLTQIGKEVFLNCVALQEVVIPTELSDVGNRAFCRCEQLQRFTPLDWGDIEQGVQAEHNAFFMCFFPRVRTPCGHGAQVIVEGREERQMVEEGTKTPKTNPKPNTQARRPTPPSCSLPYTLGETCETETSDN